MFPLIWKGNPKLRDLALDLLVRSGESEVVITFVGD
jgi:hypothetical protein